MVELQQLLLINFKKDSEKEFYEIEEVDNRRKEQARNKLKSSS